MKKSLFAIASVSLLLGACSSPNYTNQTSSTGYDYSSADTGAYSSDMYASSAAGMTDTGSMMSVSGTNMSASYSSY